MESGNITSPTDNVSDDIYWAFYFLNSFGSHKTIDAAISSFRADKILFEAGYFETGTKWYANINKNDWKSVYITDSTIQFSQYINGQSLTIVYDRTTDTITDASTSMFTPLKYDKNNTIQQNLSMKSDPTEPMQIATKQYVDNSIAASGTDISLGITSASVGQIIKVKAVDESGKPTAWEAADMAGGESSFPKFEKLLTHTITEEEIAANPAAFMWNTTQIPNLNDFNVFTLTIRNPDNTTKITFTKWVRLKINNVVMGNICGTTQGEGYKYSISANRLYGFWVSDNMYNPNNNVINVLTPPYSRQGFDSNLAASEAVTSIGFTSYGGDYGLTAGIVVEIWGAK